MCSKALIFYPWQHIVTISQVVFTWTQMASPLPMIGHSRNLTFHGTCQNFIKTSHIVMLHSWHKCLTRPAMNELLLEQQFWWLTIQNHLNIQRDQLSMQSLPRLATPEQKLKSVIIIDTKNISDSNVSGNLLIAIKHSANWQFSKRIPLHLIRSKSPHSSAVFP